LCVYHKQPPIGCVRTLGPTFCRLWTKVHRIKFTCAGVSVVCNAVFRLTIVTQTSKGCIQKRVAFQRYSRSSRKVVQNWSEISRFWAAEFGEGEGPPKFLTEFYKSGSPLTMWQSLMTIGQATSEIRRRKKMNKERRSKLQR